MRSESHFQANIRKACRTLKRLDRNQRMKIVSQVRSGTVAFAPLEPALSAVLEGHAECSVEGQDDRAAGDPQHSGRRIGGPHDREGARDRAERYMVKNGERQVDGAAERPARHR
jgi:hypothetical protein